LLEVAVLCGNLDVLLTLVLLVYLSNSDHEVCLG